MGQVRKQLGHWYTTNTPRLKWTVFKDPLTQLLYVKSKDETYQISANGKVLGLVETEPKIMSCQRYQEIA